MILATAAVRYGTTDTTAPCPKCATTMVLVAITHHPIVTHMERHTFLCAECNQTKTYMLRTNLLSSAAAEGVVEAAVGATF